MARLLSTESSFLPLWGVLLLEEWEPSGQGHAMAAGAFSSSCSWWSGREDSTSSSIASSPGGESWQSMQLIDFQNITLVALPLSFLAQQAKQQVHPTQGSAEACSASGLSR